ncbi:MAG: GNAT family N-acetyltransferase [Rhodospirillaceae bacterium]|nr:GNAT family N-acetyltransferase [Rhodospirillaceae bacterium]
MPVVVRDLTMADADWFLPLNNAEVPHVNALDEAVLAALLAEASLARAAEVDGKPAAALIVFSPGATYGSANYRWYSERYEGFVYIDRVVTDPAFRGQGLARGFYDEAWVMAAGQNVMLCCEVNEEPPNPGSMRFHERFGFKPVGGQQTEGGKKTVVLLAREPEEA